jgi:glutamate racemase
MTHTNSIGIFDSGFGGLTVMRAIRALLPYENITYFGDTARLPYGSKSRETILRYSLENISFLKEQKIKLLVIACHTACSCALDEIRQTLDIPVIAILEQGIEEILALNTKDKIAILGTKATISSGIYQREINSKLPHTQLFPISCPLFVPLVEEGFIEHRLTELAIQEYLHPIKQQHVNAVLLACTHFPLLYTMLQKELGDEVSLLDPAASCAQATLKALKEHQLLNPKKDSPSYRFFVSDDPEKFRLLGEAFLNYPIHLVNACNTVMRTSL